MARREIGQKPAVVVFVTGRDVVGVQCPPGRCRSAVTRTARKCLSSCLPQGRRVWKIADQCFVELGDRPSIEMQYGTWAYMYFTVSTTVMSMYSAVECHVSNCN